MKRNNENFKRICTALGLSKGDVHEILAGAWSRSQIDGWRRSEGATKLGTGSAHAPLVGRYRDMPDDAFDAFCAGLVGWVRESG